MKAIVYQEYGSPDLAHLAEVDKPVISDDQVLVRVHGAAVNPGDWFWLTGAPYVMRPAMGLLRPRDEILGRAVAGRVEAMGRNVRRFQLGEEVYAEISKGGFAEYVAVAQEALARKPSSLTFEEAAAVPLVGVTALEALRDHGKLQPGQKVLINGAAGGVGTYAVQIAKSLDAEVTGVCSTSNVELVRAIGADHVIDYTQENFTSSRQQYDLVLDNVGNHSLSELRRALTPNGTLIPNSASGGRWFGSLGRVLASVVLSPFVGQTLRPFVAKSRTEDLDVLTELIESGKVTPVLDRIYPLSEAAEALAHYGQGHARGKVVISI